MNQTDFQKISPYKDKNELMKNLLFDYMNTSTGSNRFRSINEDKVINELIEINQDLKQLKTLSSNLETKIDEVCDGLKKLVRDTRDLRLFCVK